ncbi:MAG: hypothetical protein ACPGC9_01450 [Cytophagales bacterium]
MKKKPVIVFGVANRTSVILDILEKNDFLVYGILEDDNQHQGTSLGIIPVLGKTDEAQFIELLNEDCLAFIAYDDIAQYRQLFQRLRKRYVDPPLMNVIAPEVSLPKRMEMGVGNFMQPYACFGTGVILGSHTYIGFHSVIEHDAVVEDFVHIDSRVTIGPSVRIHSGVDIGPNVIIAPGITVGEGAQIKPNTFLQEDAAPYAVIGG